MRLARLRWLLGLALIGAVCGDLGARPAAAQSRIEVPDGCGNEAEFQRELQRLTGTPAPPDVPSSLVIEALGGGREGYELRLALGDERRVLRDPQCRVLWRSALVIVAAASRGAPAPGAPPVSAPEGGSTPLPPASAVPPSAAPSSPAPSSPAARAPVPPSAAPPTPRPPAAVAPLPVAGERATMPRPRPSVVARQRARRPRPPSRRGGRAVAEPREASVATRAPSRSRPPARGAAEPAGGVPRMGADVGLGVSAGVVPELGAVLDVGARLEVLPWALGVSLRHWPQRTASREGRAVDVSAVGGRIAGLFRVAPAWTLLVGLEVNRLLGEGADGVSGRSSAPAWQLAPTAGLSVITWDNEYLRLEVGAAGRASLVRPEFVVTGFGDLYRVPVLGADAIIRGAWLFR